MKNGMRIVTTLFALGGLGLGIGLLWTVARAEDSIELTPSATAAVKRLFPQATILDVKQEREEGVQFYEVTVREGDETIGIEVTADGAVGEVESGVVWGDLDEKIRQMILAETGGKVPQAVERHEVWGIPAGESFRSVPKPIVLYEAQYEKDGAPREVSVTAAGLVLMETDDGPGDDADSSDEEGSGGGDEPASGGGKSST